MGEARSGYDAELRDREDGDESKETLTRFGSAAKRLIDAGENTQRRARLDWMDARDNAEEDLP